ncbi:MAG TPA: SpoIID/LytB domain-containing protein [Acetivibrio sp.]|uniref:SpoIID/LytB domain-containing protein n=1 Tax=Acetivibrio sp. TaxID=1872092 RepID=UPI002B98803D|nr:SpoIID/LytB domain-containing protein [Acetivibrio sp.]HOM03012.1 SpoIID/LytB domain-containing protein [Acetivibrio sp.]
MKGSFWSKAKAKSMVFRLILISLIYVSVLFVQDFTVYAYQGIPQKVRIGLLFNDSQTGQYSAVSSFTVDSQKGLQLGYFSEEGFVCLFKEPSKDAVTVRKDAFFAKGSSGLTEFDPSSGKIPSGEIIGAYHIKIGKDYKDYNSLYKELVEVKQKGVDAYPAYDDGWQIWTGFYLDENEAQTAITKNIDPALGTGDYSVVSPSASRITVLSKDGQPILVFDSIYYAFGVQPEVEDGTGVLRINGDDKSRYRGGLEVLRLSGSDMTVINVINIEQYLYGVVPYEIQASSHPEALKAQAVAARTYTVNNLNKYKRLQFDLCPTVYSQVYKGFDGEAASTNKAVDDTKGKIVTYNGKPASVFYFSSSGGRTEDVRNVWGSEGYPYLVSVEDKYESGDSWHYNWEVSFTAQKIKQIMTDRGLKLGDILGIYITKRSEAGRATEVIVKGSQGEKVYTNSSTRSFLSLDSQWYEITTDADIFVNGNGDEPVMTQLGGKKVMTASGLKTVNSTNGKVNVVNSNGTKVVPLIPTNYIFKGKGWGHSVGMSQEGAKGMAKAGFTYEEILTHYFPGTKVE